MVHLRKQKRKKESVEYILIILKMTPPCIQLFILRAQGFLYLGATFSSSSKYSFTFFFHINNIGGCVKAIIIIIL